MAQATRTVNPLHFEDLEPHRFEDLIRQLVYYLRPWHSIEAVGRLGADEGIDIRTVERVIDTEAQAMGESADDEPILPREERVWIIQCKRERRIGPTKITKIVNNDLGQQETAPFAYAIAAACDFSKRTRDSFRQAVLAHGVEEFFLWGKAELEDMLFLPKNDHLLFAYFGISLKVRRRSMKTEVRSKLTLKRKLVKELGDVRELHYEPILVRDPRDLNYPEIEDVDAFLRNPLWRYWEFRHHRIDSLVFLTRKCYAYLNWEKQQWDALLDYDDSWVRYPELHDLPDDWYWSYEREKRDRYRTFWQKKIPKSNQAWYLEFRAIPYERILAVDEIGDIAHEGPHLLVDYFENGSPFGERVTKGVEAESQSSWSASIDDLERIKYFPDEFPDEEEPTLDQQKGLPKQSEA